MYLFNPFTVNLDNVGDNFWSRDAVNGYVYPKTITDSIIANKLIGGTSNYSYITYKSTTGVGIATDIAHKFKGRMPLSQPTQYACDTSGTGWRRCADDSGTDAGGAKGAGKSLKKVGQGSGIGAGDDLVGFSAMLAGYRVTGGSFNGLTSYAFLWQATQYSASGGWSRLLGTTYSTVLRGANGKAYGFSVRCVRDTNDVSDFTDPRDGTVYHCVKIGSQVWMVENLAYLPSVNAVADGSETVNKYYVYGYDGTNVATAKATVNYTTYGVLYNWIAATTSCPSGWHLPTDTEFNTLEVATVAAIYASQDVDAVTILNNGNVGIGTTSPTATLHLKAGTATANTAPLQFTSGVLETVARAGVQEFLTDDFFATITTGAARKGFVLDDGARLTDGKYPIAHTNGRLIDGPTPLAGTKVYYVSDTSGGTVNRKLTFTDGILTAET